VCLGIAKRRDGGLVVVFDVRSLHAGIVTSLTLVVGLLLMDACVHLMPCNALKR